MQQSEEQWSAEVDVIISFGSEDITQQIGLSPSSELAESETDVAAVASSLSHYLDKLRCLLFDADDDECASADSSNSV